MRQRVLIAMALLGAPKLLIADEPTTALDVTIQAQILDLIRTMKSDGDMAMILVTHDLGVVAEVVDRVLVMYGGRVMEQAPTDQIFLNPSHPYTKALLSCLPRLDGKDERLEPIEGNPPRDSTDPKGARFNPGVPRRETSVQNRYRKRSRWVRDMCPIAGFTERRAQHECIT